MKIWNFLLPETGASHEFRAESLGQKAQMVYIDGIPLAAPEGVLLFTGPCGSLLELRKRERDYHWDLLVNGLIVEEYTAGKRKTGDDTLRDLRSRPDGSYTIATNFSSAGLDLNEVRRFRFTARGVMHEVNVAHQDWVWQIIHNGNLLDRKSHSLWENQGSCRFEVDAGDNLKLEVEVLMSWDAIKMIWLYTVCANHISIQPYWSKVRGEIPMSVPEVVGACPANYSAPYREVGAAELQEEPFVPPVDLPQGVSYDSVSRSYQANIRINNKFQFLGEYNNIQEAEAKYREEAEKLRQRIAGH